MDPNIVLSIIIASFVCGIILIMFLLWNILALVEHFKTGKPFLCCLGWHKPGGKQHFDGCSFHCTCKRCNKDIMQDSQGNWF